jgi:hypothetical protein
MARLASEAKGGFFATPEDEMELILRALQVDEGKEEESYFIYDPCCGEGVALSMLSEEMKRKGAKKCRSFGSELEEGRAEYAQEALDVVLADGYQNVRTEPRFSLLWLNPPYQEGFSERAELTFLRALTGVKQGVLIKGGWLLFCIPQYVLKDTAGVISARFNEISVYRFTDENYEVFKQVVVLARFGKAPAAEQKRTYKALITIGEGEKDLLPTLDEMLPFIVPTCDQSDEPMFRAGAMNVLELSKDIMNSPLLQEIEKRLAPVSSAVTMKRPLLPIKAAHMGIAIASGAIGGNMGTHFISGVTKQKIDVEPIIDEDTGKRKGERTILHFTSIVRAFTPAGIFDLK